MTLGWVSDKSPTVFLFLHLLCILLGPQEAHRSVILLQWVELSTRRFDSRGLV